MCNKIELLLHTSFAVVDNALQRESSKLTFADLCALTDQCWFRCRNDVNTIIEVILLYLFLRTKLSCLLSLGVNI